MRKVTLIGDSIRMGYQDVVRTELEGVADIRVPEQNGGPSHRVLEDLDQWAFAHEPDLVHVNCGLHDLKKEFDQDESAVPLDQYTSNVRAILSRLKSETDAAVVFALTTPVNEAWHRAKKPFDRLEADVVAYNEVALEVCRELEVAVNDLFTVVNDAGRDDILLPDGVHFTPEGYEILGKHVAGYIRGALPAG